MKKNLWLVLALVLISGGLIFAGGSADGEASSEKKISIGATYYTLQTEFCMRMDNAAKKWAQENNVDYVGYDGQNDAATQLSQVETMISNGVDAIILNPQAVCGQLLHVP